MNVPFIGRIDERFLEHRRRSTSMGAMGGTLVGGAIFFYRLSQHVISWDLFAVILTIAVVKTSCMIYYRTRD